MTACVFLIAFSFYGFLEALATSLVNYLNHYRTTRCASFLNIEQGRGCMHEGGDPPMRLKMHLGFPELPRNSTQRGATRSPKMASFSEATAASFPCTVQVVAQDIPGPK